MAAPIRNNLSKYLFNVLRGNSARSIPGTEQNIVNISKRCLTTGSRVFLGRTFSRAGILGTLAVAGTVSLGGLVTVSRKLKVHASTSEKVQSRAVRVPHVDHGLKLTLYQFSSCPFCCKLRAVLDYYGFSYDIVEVNSVTKKQIKWSDYKKVPILVCEDVGKKGYLPLNDSSVIVSFLRTYLLDKTQNAEKLSTYYQAVTGKNEDGKTTTDYPSRYHIMYQEHLTDNRSEKERKEERKWRKWTDADLVHMISPNVYRTPNESLETFRHFDKTGDWDQNFSKFERLMVIYIGASVMYVIGKVIKRKYELNDDVRLSLYQRCEVWMNSVGNKPFHGGDKPDLADLSVYGVLTSMEGCTAFNDAIKNTNLGPWFYRVKEACQNHIGSDEAR